MQWQTIKRKALPLAIGILIACCGLPFLWSSKSAPAKGVINRPDGLYLFGGGLGHWEFKPYKQDYLIGGPVICRGEPRKNGYGIYVEVPEPRSGEYKERIPDLKTGKITWALLYEIIPSRSVLGDWDLAAAQDPYLSGDLIHYDPPSPSFFHRITDDRARQYYKGAGHVFDRRMEAWYKTFSLPQDPPYPESLFKMAAAMAHDHPDDPAFRMPYWDSLIRAGDFKTLESEIQQWRSRLDHPGFQRLGLRLADHALKAHRLSAVGQNAADTVIELLSTRTDLKTLYQRLPELIKYDNLHYPNPGLTAPLSLFRAYNNHPRVICTLATFSLIKGEPEGVLERLAALWHLGQLLARDVLPATRCSTTASIRHSAGQALEVYALNACETEAEYATLWRQLDHLARHEPKVPTIEEIFWLEYSFAPFTEQQLSTLNPKLCDEVATRYKCCTAQLQLIRMATAVRAHALATGKLPSNERELGPLLPGGPPSDPFTTAPLHLAITRTGVTCYSVGPDRIDDGGRLQYNPVNGTISHGDIVLEVPEKRAYPFPHGGLRAESKVELWRKMPEGLPLDPFTVWHPQPLIVSDDPPFIISASFERDHRKPPNKLIPYDPTNGINSGGDLFIQIPEH